MLLPADPSVKADLEHMPFKVVPGSGDKPFIQVCRPPPQACPGLPLLGLLGSAAAGLPAMAGLDDTTVPPGRAAGVMSTAAMHSPAFAGLLSPSSLHGTR